MGKRNLYKGKIKGSEKYITGFLIDGEDPFIVGDVINSTEEYITLEYWWPVEKETIRRVSTKNFQQKLMEEATDLFGQMRSPTEEENEAMREALERMSEPMEKNIFDLNLDTPEEKIEASIEHKKRLFIEYKDKNFNKSKRVIEPFSFEDDKVLAYDPEKKGIRSFHISGIRNIKITNEDFVKREEDDEE